MTLTAGADDTAAAALSDGPARRRVWPWHTVAAAAVVVGVAVQLVRPLAPDLGPPPPADAAFDGAFLARAAAYRTPLYAAAVVALVLRVAVAVAVVATGGGRWLVEWIVRRVGGHRPARAGAAVVVTVVILSDLVLLPLVFWAGFVHEGAYGLRTQGLPGWVYDWAVARVPVWGALAVVATVGFWLARVRPRRWAPAAGLAAGAASIVVVFASPLLLEPLTHRFVPLPAGAVRDEVERVVAAAGEPVTDILVADASRRTTRQNAYISGLGASRRVVLYDTLLVGRDAPEVGVVVAHELAHQRHGDVWRTALLGCAGAVIAAYALAAVLGHRVRRGRQSVLHDPYAAGVVVLVALLLTVASQPVQAGISRRAETAADLVALELTDAPAVFTAMQQGLARANLSEPQPPRWVVLWRGSHPTPMARIGMARWWQSQ